MTDQAPSYDDLLTSGWLPNAGKGMTTRRFTSLSVCLVQDGKRLGCVQGYGRTPREAEVDAAAQADRFLRRHAHEEGAEALRLRLRRRNTMMEARAPHSG